MSWRRIAKWSALGLVAALALIVLAAWLLSFTGVYQAWARGIVLRTIEERLQVRASLGRVTGNPLYRISVHDLVLSRGRATLLAARRLSLSYFLPEVVFATPVVKVGLEGFDLNLTPEVGRLQDILKPVKPGGPKAVVSSLSLEQGRLTYASAPGSAPLVVEDIDLEGAVSLPRSAGQPLAVNLRRASFRLKRPQVVVRSATGSLQHGPRKTTLDLNFEAAAGTRELAGRLRAEGSGGTLAAATGRGTLEVERLRLASPAPGGTEGRGSLAFTLAEDRLTVSQGTLTTPAAQTTFRGTVAGLSALARGGWRAELAGNLAVSDLAALTGSPQLAGRAAGAWRLRAAPGARGAGTTATASLEVQRLSLARIGPGGLQGTGDLAAAYQGGALRISRGNLKTPAAQTTFSGQVVGLAEGNPSAELAGRLQVSDLARLTGRPTLAGQAGIDYRLRAHSVVEKGERRFQVDFSAKSARLTLGGYRFEGTSAAGSWRPPVLRLERLSTRSAGLGQAAVSGTYGPEDALALDYSAGTNNIGGLASRLGAAQVVAGSLKVSGRLSGPAANPATRGTFSGQGLAWGAYSAAGASGGYEVTGLRGQRQGQVSANLSEVSARGRRFPEASLTTTLPQQGSLTFSAEARQDAATRYRARGRASGLGSGRQVIELAAFEAEAGALTLRNTAPLPVIVTPQAVQLPRLSLAAADNSLQAGGSATVPGPVDVLLSFKNARLADVTRLIRVNFPVSGSLTGRIDIAGTTAEPLISADLRAQRGRISDIPFSTLTTRIGYRPESARIDGTLDLAPAGSVAVQGNVPVKVSLMPPEVEAASARGLIGGLGGPQAVPGLLEEILRGLGGGAK